LTQDNSEEHWAEVDRLWLACRRDLAGAVEESAGLSDGSGHGAVRRFQASWERLCAADLRIAAAIYHGLSEVVSMAARQDQPDSPASSGLSDLHELAGIVGAGRSAYPDSQVEAIGELYDLGLRAIRDEIEHDLGEAPDPEGDSA
jgi:hypothetical protein